MSRESYRDVDAALRAAVKLPSASALGLVQLPVALSDHATLTEVTQIGRGGMGAVFSAHDSELQQRVAVKLLRPGVLAADAPERLRREAATLRRLDHPGIVRFHRLEEHGGQPLLVMEFVDGVPLRRWLGAEPRGRDEVLERLLECGEALSAAHEQGFAHRDFKPDNVMVRSDGRACVLDFGLARVIAPSDGPESGSLHTLTRTGAVLGTRSYMAPEQQAGGRGDALSDQFAFAVTCWEALTGELPGAQAPQLPESLSKPLGRALREDPRQRFAAMQPLLTAIRHC